MAGLREGDEAPGFAGETHAHGRISLSALRGRTVVLYWYPKDDTPGCTIEACNFRDDYEALRAAGAEVIGVSCDDLGSHEAFASKFRLPFPLLSDPDASITRAYGVPTGVDGNETWPKRWTFLIGPDGRIVRKWEKVDVKSHSKEILAILAALPR
jgi:peroxiredoxin Q/BCP